MVTGLLVRRDEVFKTRFVKDENRQNSQEDMARVLTQAFKEKALIKTNSLCMIGTNTLITHKGADFKYGSFQMIDPRHPSVKLSIQVDKRTADIQMFGKSVRTKRQTVYRD